MTRGASETRPDTRRPEADPGDWPAPAAGPEQPLGEVNGPKGLEPTRFGDWEKGGRCSDF